MPFKFFTSTGQEMVANSIADLPVGAIVDLAASSIPNGWLACDGSVISRTGYPDLFAAIGTFYGAGDGSTTFKIPSISGSIIYASPINKQIALGKPPAYVTSLPSNPIDGQEIYYQADGTAGVIWHLRYRSGSASAYKWEFVGGSPLFSSNNNYPAAQNPGQTWVDVTSAVTITAPVAGDYIVTFTGKHDATTQSVDNFVIVNVTTSALGAPNTNSALAGFGGLNYSTNPMRFGFERVNRLTGVAASATIKMQVYTYNVSTIVHHTSMSVLPVRVG